jgi:acyl carrier protein
MTQSELEILLIEAVNEIQKESGREVMRIDAETKPLSDVPGFTSLNAVEATLYVEERLGTELDFSNVFHDGLKELSIREAAERILKKIAAKK